MADWLIDLAVHWGAWKRYMNSGPSIHGTMGRICEEGPDGALIRSSVPGHRILAHDAPKQVTEFNREWLHLPDMERSVLYLCFVTRPARKHERLGLPERTFYNVRRSALDRIRRELSEG